MPENNDSDFASKKEKFDLSFSMLKDYYTAFIDVLFKSLGIAFLIVGWLVSSATTRDFIKAHPVTKCAAIGALAIGFGIYYYHSKESERKSYISFKNLEELNYMPSEYYKNYYLTKKTLWLAILSVMLTVMISCIVIISC